MGIDFYAKFAPEDRDNVVKEVGHYFNITPGGWELYTALRLAVNAVQSVVPEAWRWDMEYALWNHSYNGVENISVINTLFPGGVDNADCIYLGNTRNLRAIITEVDPNYRPDVGYFPYYGYFPYCGVTTDKKTVREILGVAFADFGIADAILPFITNIYWA